MRRIGVLAFGTAANDPDLQTRMAPFAHGLQQLGWTRRRAECIRSGSVWEAESNIELVGFVPAPTATDQDAPFTVKRVKL
jgi:hypothetical protein